MAEQAAAPTMTKEERATALREAYSEAQATLRENHRKEFDDLHVKAAKKRGIDYKPKPTPEEKAKAEMDALLQQFPNLRGQFAGADETPEEPAAEEPVV